MQKKWGNKVVLHTNKKNKKGGKEVILENMDIAILT